MPFAQVKSIVKKLSKTSGGDGIGYAPYNLASNKFYSVDDGSSESKIISN